MYTDISEDSLDDIIKQVLASGCTKPLEALALIKPLLLQVANLNDKGSIQKVAGSFTEEEVTNLFQLSYQEYIYPSASSHWEIEKDAKCELDFPISPSICKLSSTCLLLCMTDWLAIVLQVETYRRNFSRSSKATCRTAIDILLNECLTSIVSSL